MTNASIPPAEEQEYLGFPKNPSLKEGPASIPVDLALIQKYYEGLGEDGQPNQNGLSDLNEWRRVHELMNYHEWNDAGEMVILKQYETWKKLMESTGQSID